MKPLPSHVLLALMLGAITLIMLLSAWVYWLRLRLAGQRIQAHDMEAQLARTQAELTELRLERDEQRQFLDTLNHAEIGKRLQGQTAQVLGRDTPPAPERYRYVEKMVATGMRAEEIAGVLSMSEAETRQLVTLATMALEERQKTLSSSPEQPKKKEQEALGRTPRGKVRQQLKET